MRVPHVSKKPAIFLVGLHSYIYTFHCVRISLCWAWSYFWRSCILFLQHDCQMLATYLHSNDFSSTREKRAVGRIERWFVRILAFMNDLRTLHGLIVTRAIHQLFPVFFLGPWYGCTSLPPLRLGRALWLALVIGLWTGVRSMTFGRKL